MSTAELKIELINKITKLNETRIIKEIERLIDFELEMGEFRMSEEQKIRITEAQKDTILSEDEANKAIEVWLQEK